MAKIYIEDVKLTAIRNKIFASLVNEEQLNIFEVISLSSGDYLPIPKMIDGKYNVYGGGGTTDKKHNDFNVSIKTLGIGRVGARCGCVFKIEPQSWITDNALFATKIDSKFDLDFLIHFLNFKNLNQYANTAAQPVIGLKRISGISIPDIGLKLQKEIVLILNNVESGSIEIEADKYGIGDTLNFVSTKENLENELTHQLSLVKKLRQQLLQDAVQGKLVEQNATDETASELLKIIKAEKEQLIKAGKLKKEKELPAIKDDEMPFEIPESWVWCRLGEVGKITGGGTPSMGNDEYWNGNIPWVSPKDMWTEFVSDTEMKVTLKGIKESSTNLIPIGSLLIVGRSGILKRKLPVAINTVECTVNQDIKVIIPHLVNLNRYLQFMFWGLEPIVLKEYVKFGMTVHSLKYDEFSQMPIPLPPIVEQNRIVQKLDELMQYCNELEANIKKSAAQNEKLLQQVLREALRR